MTQHPAFLKICIAAGIAFLLVSHIRVAHAGSLTFHGPEGTSTVVTRDRPHPNENITSHIFSISEMIGRCVLFKLQSTMDERLIESVDSDIYSVSFRSSNGDCNFRYEGGIRVLWSCESGIYRECLRAIFEAAIGHRLHEKGYGDSVQAGAPPDTPFKIFFTFASDPSHESSCRLLMDGMGNPSYEPGYIYFMMSVQLSMNCRDEGVQ